MEDIILKYTVNILDTVGLINPDPDVSITRENCIIDDMWLRKITEELKTKVVGKTRQLLDGDTSQLLGNAMKNSRLLKLLHTKILSYNNE